MRWRYRAGQFLRRLRARPTAEDLRTAREVLPRGALGLFSAMPPGDQLHGLAVLHLLCARGPCGPALAQAALLHDVGKAGFGLTLAHRSLAVVLERWGPGLLRRIAATPSGWRRPFHAHLHHAEIGARRAAEAGCDALAVALIRYHDAPDGWPGAARDELAALDALQQADEHS